MFKYFIIICCRDLCLNYLKKICMYSMISCRCLNATGVFLKKVTKVWEGFD